MNLNDFLNRFGGDVSDYEMNTSVDCVVFTIKDNKLKVLLTSFLYESGWMLPGGFVRKMESTDVAAQRILEERTGVKDIYLQQFKVFSDPERFSFKNLFSNVELSEEERKEVLKLPKRVISIGYFALVNFEALDITGGLYDESNSWGDVLDIRKLLFDHNEIVNDAVKALQKEMYIKPIGYNLLPEKFTMPELQKLYEIILNKSIERSSFQRKMLKWDIYERLEERREGVAHKRPFLYRFDKEKYKLAQSQGLNFGV